MRVEDDMAQRILMHSSAHSDGADDLAGDEHTDDATLALRIAAVFIIFAAGMIGGIPPLFMKAFQSPGHPAPRILRALGAGIILSLALIHIIPEAVTELDALGELMGDHPYNVAGPCVIFGVLFMVALESIIHFVIDKQAAKTALSKASSKQHVAEALECSNVHGTMMHDPHTHVCVAHQSHMLLDMVSAKTRRDQVLACLFELGCIFHSFIIGLTLGVNTTDIAVVRSLLIALAFHQLLEGIALSSFITRAQLGRVSGFVMVLAYSLTCPVGVAIGIGVADSYDAESTSAIATQGIFNGLSGGMLLYIALVQIIAEDFSRREISHTHTPVSPSDCESDAHHVAAKAPTSGDLTHESSYDEAGQSFKTQPWWLVPSCYAALFLGSAMMALLAIWA